MYYFREDLNQIMESNGARNPGILVLTVSLSKPFRRLEKYHGILLELERHLEDNHIDRVDVHHSIDIYKEIAVCCFFILFNLYKINYKIIIHFKIF